MKYARICRYIASQMWAVEPEYFHQLLSVLAFRAAGHAFTADEIRARIGDGGVSAGTSRSGNVAVIPVRGMIANRMGSMDDSSGGTSCERISAMIDQVAADSSVSTIVYDFDTPGGTVGGIQATAAKMFGLRGVKKQIAMVNSLCASAGYWLASQCDEIVSIPDGETGSIGVRWTPHEDISAALAKEGIVITEIYAGKYKTEGSPFQPMSAETKAFKKAQADEIYAEFLKAVARGRGVTANAVENGYGEGRVLLAKAAKAAGLIDRVDTMENVIGGLVGRRSSSGMRAEGEALAFDALTPEKLAELEAREGGTPVEGISVDGVWDDDDLRQRLERF